MKRTLLSTALLAALTLPAFAGTDSAPMTAPSPDNKDMKDMKQVNTQTAEESDAGFYLAGFGGAQFDTNYGDERQTLTGNTSGATAATHADIHSDWGGVGGIKAGYNFQSQPFGNFLGLRLQPGVEAEAMYIGLDGNHENGAFLPGGDTRFSSNSADFFLNGILRFKNNSIITPYVGIGVGMQYITTHGEFTAPGVTETGLDTSDFDFAAQALFGIDVAICKHVSLFTEYKFIDALGTDAKNSNVGVNTTYRFKPDQIQQNLITAGVKYTF